MHLPTTISVLAAVVPGVLGQVKFTKPDVNQKLNLSAESIIIAWTLEPESQPAKESPVVDLWWYGNGFGHGLAVNLSSAPGVTEFEWKPQKYRDALLRTNYTLSSTKDFFFELKYHEVNSSRGTGIKSEKYAVEGYPIISSGAGRHGPSAAFMMALAGLVSAAVFL